MDSKLERIKDINIENFIWVIYIGIIILSWISNSKEKKYILYNDQKSKKEYQNLIVLIFSVLVIIYYYFLQSSYNDIKSLTKYDTSKKRNLTYGSYIGSLLIFISGIIFLYIAVVDEDIDIELAFN